MVAGIMKNLNTYNEDERMMDNETALLMMLIAFILGLGVGIMGI